VIVIVPVIAEFVLLVAVNAGTFPVPFAANPIAGFELVQLSDIVAVPPKVVAGTEVPAH
jgi:hypothetical protein